MKHNLIALFFAFSIIGSSISEDITEIAIRHDRDQQAYLELGKQFPSVIKVGKRGGDGTLIDDEWVLTAAHVARGMYRRTDGKFSVWVNETIEIPVEQVIIHPRFGGFGPHDIALIKLSRKVNDVEPLSLYKKADEVGKKITIVGHGYTKTGIEKDWQEDDRRRGATNQITSATDDHIIFVFDAPDSPGTTELEGTPGPGDSGGPALIQENGTYYVAGVSSMGDNGANGPGTYGATEYFGRVSNYADWIEKTISNPPSERFVNVNPQPGNGRRVARRGPGGPEIVVQGPGNLPPGVIEMRDWGLLLRESPMGLNMIGKIDDLVPAEINNAGIRPPAKVKSINGKAVNSNQLLQEILKSIKKGETYSVTFNYQNKDIKVELRK